jgi:hypothetical protein
MAISEEFTIVIVDLCAESGMTLDCPAVFADVTYTIGT